MRCYGINLIGVLINIGGIPFDGSPLVDFITITVTAIVPIYVMATIGNIFAVVCLIFTIIFRNKK